jgi:glycosyltransferase involved in cell wall biosynthesis
MTVVEDDRADVQRVPPRRGSVIIPAHDEESTIHRALAALLGGAQEDEFCVVVACNGCTDRTAEVARRAAARLPGPVSVLELDAASKPGALRAAERLCPEPRLYLDADVLCTTTAARQLLDAVEEGADIAVPTRVLDLTAGSLWARFYYRTWEELPWIRRQLAGRGAYALSTAARSTFGEFPDLVGDDRFATTRVSGERSLITPSAVVVRPPARLRDVIRIRSRIYAANAAPELDSHDASLAHRWSKATAFAAQRPSRWAGFLVFSGATVLAKALAWRARRRGPVSWARDGRRGAA